MTYLVCLDDKQLICVGKYVRDTSGPPMALNVNRKETAYIDRALRRFLAEHVGHQLMVTLEDGLHLLPSFETEKYREIGGDEMEDISLDDYLRDLPG